MLLKKNYYFKISFFLITVWIFSAPHFSLFYLFSLKATNIFLLFPLIIFTLINIDGGIKLKRTYFFLCLFLLISLILPSLISASLVSIIYALILAFAIIFSFLIGYVIESKLFFNLLLYSSSLNFFFSLTQIFNPYFKWPSTHLNPTVYKEKPFSALSQYLPSLPSLGRIEGIFDENGPMVISLLLISSILFLYYLKNYNFFNFKDDYFMLSRYKLKKINLIKIILILNLFLIFFTGSKLILCIPFIFFLIRFDLKSSRFLKFNYSNKLILIFFSIFLPTLFIGTTYYLSLEGNFTKLPFELWRLPALKYRLTLFPEVLNNLSLFSGVGIKSSSNNSIDAVNGFIIYLISLGPFFSIGLFSIFSYAILSITNSLTILVIFYLTTITAGSLFNFPNTLFFIFLGVMESNRAKFSILSNQINHRIG